MLLVENSENTKNYKNTFPIKMTFFKKKKQKNKKQWVEDVEKLETVRCWWEWKVVHLLWWLLKKWSIKLPYDPTIPLLGIYPKEMQTKTETDNLYACVHSSFIHHRQKVEATQVCVDGTD